MVDDTPAMSSTLKHLLSTGDTQAMVDGSDQNLVQCPLPDRAANPLEEDSHQNVVQCPVPDGSADPSEDNVGPSKTNRQSHALYQSAITKECYECGINL